MAAAAILDFRNRKFLFTDGIWTGQTHHCTKFCKNRSFRYGYIAIFLIFKMATAAILDFWKREILFTIGVQSCETHQHANFFFKIGQLVAKILRFFDFSRWRPPPSCIFEIVNFYYLRVPDASLYQISWKLFFCCGDIAIFQIFKMAAAAILDFWNHEILLAIGLERVEMHQRAKFC